MSLSPIEGFTPLNTHHCVSGSMRHVYLHNQHDISEDMLLGLGQGVGFSYWHFKDQPPFLGGRAMPKPSMEELAGQRTGVKITTHTTTSERRSRKTLIDTLEAGQPAMLQVDMGLLPYFDFQGTEYHFGGHVVVACGYDAASDQMLIADRDGLYPVSMEDLEKARASTYKPFPPKRRWYIFDFSEKRKPTTEEVCEAIYEQTKPMLDPPISNIGVKGIRKAAQSVSKWEDILNPEELRWALFNGYIFISSVGGTGGGAFRYMFSRFLREGAEVAGKARLKESADEFKRIGDRWEELAAWFRQISEKPEPAAHIQECWEPLQAIADLEERAWTRLREIVTA